MKTTVNEQLQKFWLAFPEGWIEAGGHEIKVGKYRFSAVPVTSKNKLIEVNVSEVTSGMRVMTVPVDPLTMLFLGTKEGTIEYFYHIGEKIKKIIGKIDNMDERIESARKRNMEKLGEMPPIKNINLEDILAK